MSLGVALLVALGCGDDSAAPVDASTDVGMDTGRRDAGPPDGGPPPTADPHKGPWVQAPGTDHVAVLWESQLRPDSVAVRYTPAGGGASVVAADGTSREGVVPMAYGATYPIVEEPDVAGTFYVNEVRLEGLEAGRCYVYEIDGHPDATGRFCTMHETADAPIHFYAIGDTNPTIGGTGHYDGLADSPVEFTVHLGDLQYYSSLFETWQGWFGLMRPLLQAGAFLPCVGNHEDEIEGEFEAFYERLFGSPHDDGDVTRYHYQTGGVHFFSLSSESPLDVGSEQIGWLEAELAEAEATAGYRFSVLYMHRPIVSTSDFRPRAEVRAALEPIIEAHRIPLVLAGHVHAYERFEFEDTTYVTSGGGGVVVTDTEELVEEFPEDAARRVIAGAFPHGVYFTIRRTADADLIEGVAVDDDGVDRDSFTRTVPFADAL